MPLCPVLTNLATTYHSLGEIYLLLLSETFSNSETKKADYNIW